MAILLGRIAVLRRLYVDAATAYRVVWSLCRKKTVSEEAVEVQGKCTYEQCAFQ